MEDFLMEEDFELFERGLLSEVNEVIEFDSDENEPQEPYEGHDPNEPYSEVVVGGMSRSIKKKKVTLLGYLGTVRESKPYNPKAWLLQSILNELRYPLTADGKFGPLTRQAVEKFQADYGLDVDGEVGRKTWTKLINLGKSRISNSGISDQDYETAAKDLDVEVEVIKAIKDVESGPSGSFLFSNHPTILFEGHIFWKELDQRRGEPSKYRDSDILYQKWTKDHYVSGVAEYVRLKKARDIDIDAANASASWGLFQIMGNNFELCGCKSVEEFVTRMCTSEGEQLKLFVEYIKKRKLHQYLKPGHTGNIPWAEFARRYNGREYKKNQYDTRLENAYWDYKNKKK